MAIAGLRSPDFDQGNIPIVTTKETLSMRTKSLIAVAIASALAMPMALAQSGPATNAPGTTGTTGGPGDPGSSNVGPGPRSPSANAGVDATASTRGSPASANASVSASQFQKLDKNKDGFLSKDEVSETSDLSARFDQLDANGDGKLSQAELSASGAAAGGTKRADRMSRNDRSVGPNAAPNMPRAPRDSGNPPGKGDLEAGSTSAN
jgi:hypothetical protein